MENSEKTEVEVELIPFKESEITETKPVLGQVFDLTNSTDTLPDLSTAVVIPLDLMSDYWTPEALGETKSVFFVGLDTSPVIDQLTGNIIDLDCAFFLERDVEGQIKQIRNGSKRLVGAMIANNVQKGTALRITYTGKKKNRSNSKESDNWSIKPLRLNLQAPE